MDLKELPIEKSIELNLEFPSVSERYFTPYYFIPKKQQMKNRVLSDVNNIVVSEPGQTEQKRNISEDTCVLMHSNRLCVITLSYKHPIIQLRKTVIKVRI